MKLNGNLSIHETVQRPWGFYRTLFLNDSFQLKIISINPKAQLSLQSHDYREEHWTSVEGDGIAQIEEAIVNVSRGSSIFIPKGSKHRLTNTDGNNPLLFVEVQIGSYFGEDDIHRYEDIYGRA